MGWLDAIRSALGFRPALATKETAALGFTDAALARMRALPAGHGIHVETVPVERGRVVRVDEGESQGPPPPVLGDLPVSLSDRDLERLSGRTLDHRDGRWLVSVALELRARETPNPDARLYLGDQVLGVGRPAFFAASDPSSTSRSADPDDGAPVGADVPDLAARLLAIPGVRSVLIRETTANVERAPGVAWDGIDAAVDAALREHLLLLGDPVEGGVGSAGTGTFEDEVRAVIAEQIAPAVHRDGGDVELVGVSNGVVKVSMVGACRTCPSSSATLHHGIERTLKEAFPGRIERVEAV